MFEPTLQERHDLATLFAPNIESRIGRPLTAQEMASLAAGVADITPKYRPSPVTTGLICSAIFGAFALAFKATRKDALKYALGGGAGMWWLSSVLDSSTQAGYEFGFKRGIEALGQGGQKVGWDWPWVELPIAPRTTMHTQTDPRSLYTLPSAIEQFYIHNYVVPGAKAFDRWNENFWR